jgi:hypothetical protein
VPIVGSTDIGDDSWGVAQSILREEQQSPEASLDGSGPERKSSKNRSSSKGIRKSWRDQKTEDYDDGSSPTRARTTSEQAKEDAIAVVLQSQGVSSDQHPATQAKSQPRQNSVVSRGNGIFSGIAHIASDVLGIEEQPAQDGEPPKRKTSKQKARNSSRVSRKGSKESSSYTPIFQKVAPREIRVWAPPRV